MYYKSICSLALFAAMIVAPVTAVRICDPGQYRSGGKCRSCPDGTINPNSGATSSSACTTCPVGTYANTAHTACVPCPANTYANLPGTDRACLPCKNGGTAPAPGVGATAGATQCTCTGTGYTGVSCSEGCAANYAATVTLVNPPGWTSTTDASDTDKVPKITCTACPGNLVVPAGNTASTCKCPTGFADCNTDLTDGCEINTVNDEANCGACFVTCGTANVLTGLSSVGVVSCGLGRCQIAGCASGSLNCDGDIANGCEVTGAVCPA